VGFCISGAFVAGGGNGGLFQEVVARSKGFNLAAEQKRCTRSRGCLGWMIMPCNSTVCAFHLIFLRKLDGCETSH
jgi:hypothetical protein